MFTMYKFLISFNDFHSVIKYLKYNIGIKLIAGYSYWVGT